MSAANTQTAPDAVDLDRLEREASATIAECEQREAALSLDALANEDAAEELRGVQEQRRAAEDRMRQAQLAREELAHRERQRQADAEQERLAGHLAEARALQSKREKAAAAVDRTAAAYCQALSEWAEACHEQEIALDLAGERALKPAGSAAEASLTLAMRAARVPRGLLDLAGIAPRPAKLTDSDPRSVEPVDG